jgi:hypothetical protein
VVVIKATEKFPILDPDSYLATMDLPLYNHTTLYNDRLEEFNSPAVSALGVRSRKLSNALNGQSWDG